MEFARHDLVVLAPAGPISAPAGPVALALSVLALVMADPGVTVLAVTGGPGAAAIVLVLRSTVAVADDGFCAARSGHRDG